MAVRSGLAGSVGISTESVFGTYVAVARFYEVENFSVKKTKNIAQGGGLAAGRLMVPGARRVLTAEGASGSFTIDCTHKDLGLLLQHAFGTTVTPVIQGAGPAYLQTHTLADNQGKSLSIQVGVPDGAGTVRPYTFLGSKITSVEFKCGGPGEILKATIEVDARACVESQTLVSPSYTAGLKPFHFAQMQVKLGTYSSEAAVDGIRGLSVKFERPQDVDRFYANNAGLKSEQYVNDTVKVTGSFNADYVDKTILADRFAADTATALDWIFEGATINATFKETFRVRVPQIFLEDTHAALDGPGVVTGEVPFTGTYDGTNYPAVLYTSTDTVV